MRLIGLGIVPALTLAGCSPAEEMDAGPLAAPTSESAGLGIAGVPPTATLNASSRKLVAAEAVIQTVTLRRVVTSAGERCGSVRAANYWGSALGGDMFRVQCGDGGDWLVKIDGDGATNVLACDVAAKMGTDCAVPAPAE